MYTVTLLTGRNSCLAPLLTSLLVLMLTNVLLLYHLDRTLQDPQESPNWIVVGEGIVTLQLGSPPVTLQNPENVYFATISTKTNWNRILTMPSTGYHSFNATASDLVSIDRMPWDTRPIACKNFHYNLHNLPRTSIISVFHNEARSTLLRTIHSFLNRTPDVLLEELLLIDDASTHPWLRQPLTDYVEMLPRVKLIRLHKRQGLIKARLRGAEEAKGDVLFFVDAHTEANVGWLPPLLKRLMDNNNSVVIPTMDIIDWQSFSYLRPVHRSHGSMTWDLVYEYKPLPERLNKLSETDPIPSPIMVGCAHAVWRWYFFETGSYDASMEIWGGENIEHSMRVWMCGGRLEIIPCSRVGHVFKPRLPYAFNDDSKVTVTRNLVRTAEVWMDDYKKYFYSLLPSLPVIDVVSLKERHALRHRLNCSNFRWFLDNVIPELPIPPEFAVYYGKLHHYNKCLRLYRDTVSLVACDEIPVEEQQFMLDKKSHLTWKGRSLPIVVNGTTVPSVSYQWKYVFVGDKGQLETHENLCLTLIKDILTLKPCDNHDNQLWSFQYHFEWTKANIDINEVYHETMTRPSAARYFGQLLHLGINQCLEVYDNTEYDFVNCTEQKQFRKIFHLDVDSKLVYKNLCFQTSVIDDLQILPCDEAKHKIWFYDSNQHILHNTESDKCLSFNPMKGSKILYVKCNTSDVFQKWFFS